MILRKGLPIFYSALLLTGVNLLLRLVGTSFQVFLSGKIGAAGVGLLQLVSSVGMLGLTAAMAGIRTTAIYLTAEELGKNRPSNVSFVLSGCFVYSILFSTAIATGIYCFAPLIAEGWIGHQEVIPALRTMAVFLPVNCLCGVMSGYFTAAGRVGTLAAAEVAEQAFFILTTTSLLLLWADSDAPKACQAVMAGSGLSSCLTLGTLVVLRCRERGTTGARLPLANRILRCALPLAVADDAKAGINTLENLMVPKRLALYAKAADPLADFGRLCGMVFPVLMFPAAILFGLCELLIPELARARAAGSKVRIRHLAGRSLHIGWIYGCGCGGLLYLMAEALCLALYKDAGAGFLLRSFALLTPMLYCDSVTDAMVKGLGQQKKAMVCNIFTAVLDVTFLFFLLPKYGMDGYFFSFLVTHLINFLLSLRLLLKITGPVLPIRKPIFCFVSASIGVLAALCFPGWIRCVVFFPVFFSLLTLLQVVEKEDLFWVKSLVKQKQKDRR